MKYLFNKQLTAYDKYFFKPDCNVLGWKVKNSLKEELGGTEKNGISDNQQCLFECRDSVDCKSYGFYINYKAPKNFTCIHFKKLINVSHTERHTGGLVGVIPGGLRGDILGKFLSINYWFCIFIFQI